MNKTFKYHWGDEVFIVKTAPAKMRPGQSGSVCGMRELDDRNLYLVEFADGWSTEVSEEYVASTQL